MNSSAFKRLIVVPLSFGAANALVAGKAMKIWIEGGASCGKGMGTNRQIRIYMS